MRLKAEWPLWLEALRKELTSLIVENEVFDPNKYEDVPVEKQNKIFNLLVLLKRKRDKQLNEINIEAEEETYVWFPKTFLMICFQDSREGQ
jgi:hypothetical protein